LTCIVKKNAQKYYFKFVYEVYIFKITFHSKLQENQGHKSK